MGEVVRGSSGVPWCNDACAVPSTNSTQLSVLGRFLGLSPSGRCWEGKVPHPHGSPLTCALCPAVCSIRVIGESDIMQEFLSESDEVRMEAPKLCLHLLCYRG